MPRPKRFRKWSTAFAALPKQIDTIVDFEWGTDVGVENLSQGFTHCFLVTFRSAEDRDAYLPHPAHKKFVETGQARLGKAVGRRLLDPALAARPVGARCDRGRADRREPVRPAAS